MISNNPLIDIACRSAIVYGIIIIGIRVFGKKELSQLSIIDLVFILLISNSVQNAMVGPDSTLQGGIIAASSLFLVNFILKRFMFRQKNVSRWIQGSPVILIHEGKIIPDHLAKERISLEEMEAAIREHGVASIEDVDLAVLEVDGSISILSNNYKVRSKKRRKAHKSGLI